MEMHTSIDWKKRNIWNSRKINTEEKSIELNVQTLEWSSTTLAMHNNARYKIDK